MNKKIITVITIILILFIGVINAIASSGDKINLEKFTGVFYYFRDKPEANIACYVDKKNGPVLQLTNGKETMTNLGLFIHNNNPIMQVSKNEEVYSINLIDLAKKIKVMDNSPTGVDMEFTYDDNYNLILIMRKNGEIRELDLWKLAEK